MIVFGIQTIMPLILLFVYLFAMFVAVHVKKDISISNFTWGGGCLVLTLYTFFALSDGHSRQIIVTSLITTWCLRLAFYVWLRYKKGADPRYISWLQYWNNYAVALMFSFLWIFVLNGFFTIVMSLPSVFVNVSKIQPALTIFDYLGIGLWLVGYFFESVSDYQMYLFKKDENNKGKILDSGLWQYSRHPNYFGEICMWWGIYLLAVSVPYGWLTIITPAAITITLLFVTGIPWAEQQMGKLPGYETYKKKTSILIPWFSKK